MAKFVRQSVYGWQQYRNDIKKKKHVFEGKEYTGWDLPMHEQIRLYRIAEARIVEVANFANFADTPPASPAAAGGRSLYKKSKPNITSSWNFQFATASVAGMTGSVAGNTSARTGGLSGHYIDLSTGWLHEKFGNRRFRLSFESGSATISAGTTAANIGGPIRYEVTGALDLGTEYAAAHPRNYDSTGSLCKILMQAVNNNTVPGGATGDGTAMSTYFTASVDSGSTGAVLHIMTRHAGAIAEATTSMISTTASVTRVHKGLDTLCGPDGATWSTQTFGAEGYQNVVRIKA